MSGHIKALFGTLPFYIFNDGKGNHTEMPGTDPYACVVVGARVAKRHNEIHAPIPGASPMPAWSLGSITKAQLPSYHVKYDEGSIEIVSSEEVRTRELHVLTCSFLSAIAN